MVIQNKPYQLLLADDDPAFRQTLRDILAPFFQLLEASSGEEAVDIIGRQRVDIALLDMHMYTLTGLQTLRVLKSVNSVAPGILITADASDALRNEEDVFSVLAKPVSKIDLVATVSTALEDAYEDPDALAPLTA
jgi:CheY-like chemotaxis protein